VPSPGPFESPNAPVFNCTLRAKRLLVSLPHDDAGGFPYSPFSPRRCPTWMLTYVAVHPLPLSDVVPLSAIHRPPRAVPFALPVNVYPVRKVKLGCHTSGRCALLRDRRQSTASRPVSARDTTREDV